MHRHYDLDTRERTRTMDFIDFDFCHYIGLISRLAIELNMNLFDKTCTGNPRTMKPFPVMNMPVYNIYCYDIFPTSKTQRLARGVDETSAGDTNKLSSRNIM